MTAERWKQIETLLEQCLEMPAPARPEFLRVIEDAELRREVESFLHSHAQAGSFLEEADRFFSRAEPDEPVPEAVIDRYRILREIGRGGMGAVYLAERADDEYQKRVALKLIKRGMDTDSVLRHFRKERQILAGFDHPNIARLLDGGSSDDGLPYFVMEFVEGLPIDEYCNTHALSIPARLQLFREICAAVSYAHRHLVIHRDIKRSNILVTAEGVPKLLDFGIAKILEEDGAPLVTLTGQRLMTPEYASPEQARGERVTTASDVYSLGVVLYELLTGQSPYGSATSSSSDFAKIISEIQPKKPSTVPAQTENPHAAIRNPKSLKGDLDNIVLMALRKEPERRYQSVEQFSEDIRRHLVERPVLARKDTTGYRAAKFVRRNTTALAAAALVFLVLIGGIIATARQAQRARAQEAVAKAEKARAERRFNDVRKLANRVLFEYHDAIKDLPGATKVRELLVKDALNYLDSLSGEATGDPQLQRELAAVYERVGDVRGEEFSGSLGDMAGAIESYTKAWRIREALVSVDPDAAQARRDLASSHEKLGSRLLDTREPSKGVEHLQKALTLRLDLTVKKPDNDELEFELAATRHNLGRALNYKADFAGSLEQYRAALATCEKLVSIDPRDRKYRRALWTSYKGLGYSLWLSGAPGAIEANRKALGLGEALLADDPINTDYRESLILSYQNAGEMRRETDKRAALDTTAGHWRWVKSCSRRILRMP